MLKQRLFPYAGNLRRMTKEHSRILWTALDASQAKTRAVGSRVIDKCDTRQ